MKLKSLQLCHFRQFYGKTPKIKFGDGQTNATVFFGVNGAGKTALLNAFTWILYGQFSKGFQLSENLVNRRAVSECIPGESIECWGELVFQHNEKTYHAKRTYRIKKLDESNVHREDAGTLQVWISDGTTMVTPDQKGVKPEDVISQVLPENLHSYFFFDGERIERLVHSTKEERELIGKATQILLGIEAWSRAEKHLDAARKELEIEWKKVAGANVKGALEHKEEQEKLLDEKVRKLGKMADDIKMHVQRQEAIDAQLRSLDGVSALQNQRDKVQVELRQARERLAFATAACKKEFSQNGYLPFLDAPVKKFREMVEGRRQKGELPTGIKTQFVQDLLDQGQCICGCALTPGTTAHQQVEGWISKGGSSEEEQRILMLSGELAAYETKVQQYQERLASSREMIEASHRDIRRLTDEEQAISDKLAGAPVENARELENRRREVVDKIGECQREHGALENQIIKMKEELASLDKEIGKKKEKEKQQIVAQHRVEVARDAKNRIAESRKRLATQMRVQLGAGICELYGNMAVNNYTPVLSEQYALSLLDGTYEVAASQGENQLLSISFIGAIIDYAKKWRREQSALHSQKQPWRYNGPNADTFPLVMDSPFGSLDPTYRRQIARRIPALADQVVIMVSQTQWRTEVEQEMESCIGKCYRFIYHTTKDIVHKDPVVFKGHPIELVVRAEGELEWTEIEEIPHG